MRSLAVLAALTGLASAQTPTPSAASSCVYNLSVSASGHIYLGGHVRVSHATLIRDLQNGCHDGPVTLVTIAASPQTAYGKVKDLLDLVHRYAPAETQVDVLTPKP